MNFIKKAIACTMLLAMSLSLAHAQYIRGNGNVVRQDREVAPFTAVNTTDGWDLVLTQGNTYAMTIESDENLVDIVQTEVRNGVLHIYSEANIRQSKKRKVYLTFRELNAIKATDGADVYAETLISADNFELDLDDGSDLDRLELSANTLTATFNGGSDAQIRFESIDRIELDADDGSDIRLRDISGTSCEMHLRDGSDAILDGRISEILLTASGGSDIEAYRLEVNSAVLDLSGSSDAEMTITGSVDLKLSDGSDLEIRGNPQITNYQKCKSCDLELN